MAAIKALYDNCIAGKKGLIFDMDGTLLDSMTLWGDIDEVYLASKGYDVPADLRDSIEGMALYEIAVYMKKRFCIPDPEEEMMQTWNQMAYEAYANSIPLKEGALEFLKKCSGAGMKLAIATSNSRILAEAALRQHGLLEMFDYVCTGDQVEKGKPDPQCYRIAADGIGLEPADCLVFEDLPMGILAARSAGMQTCTVSDAFSEYLWDKKTELADYYLHSFTDLL